MQSGDTFDLFDAASFGGSFATINTPTLPAGLAWDTTTLTTNGTIKVVCGAPVGGADAFSTPTNTPVAIAAAKFKLNDTGCGLSLTAVQNPSTQGGTLSLSATNGTVTYTPPSATFGGTDTFTYTLLDLSGSTANVTVTVTVGSGTSQSPNVVYGPSIEGSEFVVRFAGHPGWEYTVEYSPISPVNWTKKVNKIAPLNNAAGFGVGVFEFRDPLADSGLYRTVHPSY